MCAISSHWKQLLSYVNTLFFSDLFVAFFSCPYTSSLPPLYSFSFLFPFISFSSRKSNLEKEFDGVEPCPICYCILHPKTFSLPALTCPTCSNKFHSTCLYTWFKSSGKSKCVICQQPIFRWNHWSIIEKKRFFFSCS